MYYFEEEIAQTTRAAGLRGVLGETVIQFPSPDARTPVEGLDRAERFVRTFKNDGLITPAVAPHAMYTNDETTLLACAALARRWAAPILIHLAETEEEVRLSRAQHHATPAAYLDAIGFWSPRTLAAHGVWVTDDDIAILKRHAVGVAHNPESNMKLASGAAPMAKYLAAGVAVGLGTDGAASNNDLDMFEAMRQAAFLAKLTSRDPTVLPAQAVLDMATVGGARALGRDDLGRIAPGAKADLVLWKAASWGMTPLRDPVKNIVYNATAEDIDRVYVNGRVVVDGGRVLAITDEAKVFAALQAGGDRMWSCMAKYDWAGRGADALSPQTYRDWS
jgi:5-methylthioadenosine/S-adenosylhomocysteine deaminase